MQEVQIPSLDQGHPLGKEVATILVFLTGESHRQWSLVGYSPWGRRIGHDLATKQRQKMIYDPLTVLHFLSAHELPFWGTRFLLLLLFSR